MHYLLLIILVLCETLIGVAEGAELTNLALNKKVRASSAHETWPIENLVDGNVGTRWRGVAAPISWVEIDLDRKAEIGGIHVYSGHGDTVAIENFVVRHKVGTQWKDVPGGAVMENSDTAIAVEFTEKVEARILRLVVARTNFNVARIKEVTVWPYRQEGLPPLGTGVIRWTKPLGDEDVPRIYLNQSGFNLDRPKRFTAPTLDDGTPFVVRQEKGKEALFEGKIEKHVGDFSDFNPTGGKDYVVEAGGHVSFPFRIGPWWLERATYQNAVDFMADTRHYHGTFTGTAGNSFGWRDDCHFAFEVNTLVAQFLSNPLAYERMPRQIEYKQPPKSRFWGYMEPYSDDAPDIVKLIHWGADVITSNNLRHEMFKEQCAYFLYAWPWLKEWLPEQNYRVVSDHAFAAWSDPSIYRRYPWNESPEHDLFVVKTKLGTTKGELPPGHSVQPNLLMYEVAKRDGRDDAEKYFDTAYAQTQWMIANLDWNDPQTTKGQRMSEHVTLTGLAHFMLHYPDRAPPGLKQKIVDWAHVMVRRSDNMWDFRRLTDDGDWVPSGWNEPGNVAGFPACLLAAAEVIDDTQLSERLVQLAYSHLDNVFGRNPTGRHFSHDGCRHIDGVELGWYSCWRTGVGMLQKSRFILDGAPKTKHYPYHPEYGNAGGTEGWVNFNTAFNASLAALAYHDTEVRLIQKREAIDVLLRAPLNFDYNKPEPVTLRVTSSNGDSEEVALKEKRPYSEAFVGSVPTSIGDAKPGDGVLQIDEGGHVESSYGYGYLARHCRIQLGRLTTPELSSDTPAAGKRVRQVAPEYEGSNVFHSLYLPTDWKPGGEYPVLVEYTGNKWSGSRSTGKLADANLGYGLTGGERFIWVVLPCVEKGRSENAVSWWGDLEATLDYCKSNVPRICEQFGGEPQNVFLCGFSRGAIAVNYLGLADDEISRLWKGFISHDHYDGVFPVSDPPSTLERLKRIGDRPQLICSTMGTKKTRDYLAKHTSLENFTFLDVPVNELFKIPDGKIVHPHSDLWMSIDSTYRQQAREWLQDVLVTTDNAQ